MDTALEDDTEGELRYTVYRHQQYSRLATLLHLPGLQLLLHYSALSILLQPPNAGCPWPSCKAIAACTACRIMPSCRMPLAIMQGYCSIISEFLEQEEDRPTHVFLQVTSPGICDTDNIKRLRMKNIPQDNFI